ncbi:hypothetical protein JL722_10164 [Aureococcus anophagefferens]|nr:hypothetical protein JL722_10164 [Aureococcus anophagefferens]
MKDRRDLAGDTADDVLGWVARQGTIAGLDHVDFNFPQHLAGLDAGAVARAEAAASRRGAVCLRYPSPEFSAGALTHPDAAVRAKAVALTVEACDWAAELGTDEVVWSAFDGYDYAFQCDYDDLWARLVASFRAVCDARPATRVSLEFKPTDEHTRWFAVPSTGAALLLCADVDRANFGLTLDVGHCLAAGENPAQSVAAVAARGRLFGVQLNDGYTRLGAEDGLIFGSVHALAAQVVYWLRRARFAGPAPGTSQVKALEMNARERSFLAEAQRHVDSGRSLGALVYVYFEGDGVRIREDAGGYTRLWYAARKGWCSAITWLLKRGANVHVGLPSRGLTPLHAAAAWDRRDAAVLLLDADARVDDRSSGGWTALHNAAAKGHTDMCKLLLSRGASLDVRNNCGDDPGRRAAAAAAVASVRRGPRARNAPAELPQEVFWHIVKFWRSDRDPRY